MYSHKKHWDPSEAVPFASLKIEIKEIKITLEAWKDKSGLTQMILSICHKWINYMYLSGSGDLVYGLFTCIYLVQVTWYMGYLPVFIWFR